MSRGELRGLLPIYSLAVIGDINSAMLIIMGVYYATIQGFSPTQVGWISSGYGLTYLFMPAVLGRIGDKLPRKWSLIAATSAQTALALYFMFIIFSGTPKAFGFLLAGYIFKGVAYGFFWPSIEAFISERTEHDRKLHEKGITGFCISWSIGYTIGPLLAGYFPTISVALGFAVGAGLYLIALILILIFVPKQIFKPAEPSIPAFSENIQPGDQENSTSRKNQKQLSLLVLISSLMYAVLCRIVFNYFANYSVETGGLEWTTVLSGQVIFFIGLGRTIYFFIGWMLHKKLKMISFALVFVGILVFSLGLTSNVWLIITIMTCIGFFQGQIYYVGLEILLKNENKKKGSKAGLFESSIGLGASFTPIIAGALANITLLMPFYIFGFITVIIGIIHYISQRKINRGPDNIAWTA